MKLVEEDNKWLKEEAKNAKDLLTRSHVVIRRAQGLEALQKDNADLRLQVESLKKSREEGIARATEAASQEIENLKKELAQRDEQNRLLQVEIENRNSAVPKIREELEGRIDEGKALDRYILDSFFLRDASSSEPRPARIELVGNITQDLVQIVSEAGEAVRINPDDAITPEYKVEAADPRLANFLCPDSCQDCPRDGDEPPRRY